MNSTIKAWRTTSSGDLQRCLAARPAIFGHLENYEGKQLGRALDSFDAAGTHHFCCSHGDEIVAVARLLPSSNLQSVPTLRKLGYPVPASSCGEPSRLGILPRYYGTRIGRLIRLALVGAIVTDSLASGFDWWGMTIVYPLFRSLRWFPFDLLEPFLYPKEAGGPDTEDPVFPAFLNVHELVAATQLRPADFADMFPEGAPDIDLSRVRPAEELLAIAAHNVGFVDEHMRSWPERLDAWRAGQGGLLVAGPA